VAPAPAGEGDRCAGGLIGGFTIDGRAA
jgi:hypothetical protein